MSIKQWTLLSSETVLSNRWLSVRRDKCRLPDTGLVIDDFFVVERRDAVHIVPITKSRKVILVKQYRHASEQILYELPAGYTEKGETPQQTAKRELYEETGYLSNKADLLSILYYSPAVMTNKAYVVLCEELDLQIDRAQDDTENIELAFFDLDELVSAGIRNQVVVDAVSVSGILLAHHYLKG